MSRTTNDESLDTASMCSSGCTSSWTTSSTTASGDPSVSTSPTASRAWRRFDVEQAVKSLVHRLLRRRRRTEHLRAKMIMQITVARAPAGLKAVSGSDHRRVSVSGQPVQALGRLPWLAPSSCDVHDAFDPLSH